MSSEELINYYNFLPKHLKPVKIDNIGFKKHHVDLPARILVSGKSNTGKTLSVLNFLKKCGPQFDKLTIITKRVEPLYAMIKENNPDCCDIIEVENDDAVFPNIEDFDGNELNFVIFDDLVNSPYMKQCKEFFIRGRKLYPYPLNMCFITQDYYKTDSMLRKNMTNAWIFRPTTRREQMNIESDFPMLKDIKGVWNLLSKKNDNEVNKFINIDIDRGEVRVNFSSTLIIEPKSP